MASLGLASARRMEVSSLIPREIETRVSRIVYAAENWSRGRSECTLGLSGGAEVDPVRPAGRLRLATRAQLYRDNLSPPLIRTTASVSVHFWLWTENETWKAMLTCCLWLLVLLLLSCLGWGDGGEAFFSRVHLGRGNLHLLHLGAPIQSRVLATALPPLRTRAHHLRARPEDASVLMRGCSPSRGCELEARRPLR